MSQGREPHADQAEELPMTCRELFERLSEYLDGELSPELCAEIRRHMDGCDPCINFAKTLKITADLCRRLPAQPIPPELAAKLRAFLSAHRSSDR